jgi:hypothetical protein
MEVDFLEKHSENLQILTIQRHCLGDFVGNQCLQRVVRRLLEVRGKCDISCDDLESA